jgi:hypothetical protein
MTAKRDLKKRVRARQAKTGESYTAARRHVTAARPAAEVDDEAETGDSSPSDAPASPPIAVDSLVDVTAMATSVGLRCKILMSERLAEAIDPKRILLELRFMLLSTVRDPTSDRLRAVALHGDTSAPPLGRARDPRQVHFLARLRAGASAISTDGRALGFRIDDVAIVCSIWRSKPSLVVTTLEDMGLLTLSGLGTGTVADLQATPILQFEDQRIPMIKLRFLIGRHPTCDLQIRDGSISRQHAEVLRTERGWFIKDLESTSGIHYMGMQIDNKRIEEGDVFQLGPHAIRFTYRG